MTSAQVLLEMDAITKEFPGVRALDQVTMQVRRGDIHAICGENGAGKSTLMKVLSGVYPHGTYDGHIRFDGEEMRFSTIRDSEAKGIVIIHQELALIPELSITENIFLGSEVVKNFLIDWDSARLQATELLARVGLDIEPQTPVKNLGVGQQQLVEIAKALSKNVRLLILDEPTSALNEDDSENLLQLMLGLKAKGITCIMISHKLNEIAAVSDAVTVIRDGRTVDTYDVVAGQVDEDRIIKAMVGRSIENRYPSREPHIGELLLQVDGWTVEHPNLPGRLVCKDVSFTVHRGEVVGFAGLMGAGRTELMRSLFGRSYGNYVSGTMTLGGAQIAPTTVAQAIHDGLAYVTEDRKTLGLNLLDTIKSTIVSANLGEIVEHGLLQLDKETEVAEGFRKDLRIKSATVDMGVSTLSGGNQQKVVLAKWMYTSPEVLILDEPTRGIDVGAKVEVYNIMNRLAGLGKCIIMVSSELPEVLGMSDRVIVMRGGEVMAEVRRGEPDFNEDDIMKAAWGERKTTC